MKNNKGFTLIEMLVVVAIIGLLSSVVVVGLGSARANARDARRISDIRQIQNALEVVYSSDQKYPTALPGNVPKDPSENENYAYYSDGDQMYNLGACLEGNRPTGVSSASSTELGNATYSFPRTDATDCADCSGDKAFCVAN